MARDDISYEATADDLIRELSSQIGNLNLQLTIQKIINSKMQKTIEQITQDEELNF